MFVDAEVGELLGPGRSQGSFPFLQWDGIKGGRRHQDELGSGGVDLLDQPVDSVLVDLEPFFRERMVDAVVHPVAGHDHVGLDSLQCPVQPFVDVGTREGVSRLGLARAGLAGEPDVVEAGHGAYTLQPALGFDPGDVASGVGDRIAQEEDPLGLQREGNRDFSPSHLGSGRQHQQAGGQQRGRLHRREVFHRASSRLELLGSRGPKPGHQSAGRPLILPAR